MAMNSVLANNAYQAALKNVGQQNKQPNPLGSMEVNQGGGESFGSMVSDTVNQVIDTGKNADQKMLNQAVGKVDVVDVVTAVSETEVAMQTLVSVRDRVISAYQDILRMPI